MKPGA